MKQKSIVLTVILLFSIFLDRFSKFLISKEILLNQKVTLIENILSITKIYNTGAAFSLFQSKRLFLTALSFIAGGLILYYLIKNLKNLSYPLITGWGFVLGGTIGNLLDRIHFGYVIDFIQLDFIRFPIFNFADIFINIGVIIILIASFYTRKEVKNQK